ncbi:MAG: bifunctional diguanylate cyclase/phosphodiesterase [Pseudomonadales bacterium]
MGRPILIVDNDAGRGTLPAGVRAVCVVSLEGVGRITSMYGSEAAGLAHREFVERLRVMLRDGDQLAQINESKHCLVFNGLLNANHARLAGQKLERLFAEPATTAEYAFPLVIRAGIACGDRDEADAEELFRGAEAAREQALVKGSAYELADELDIDALRRRWTLNERVHEGLEKDELKLYYQPQVRADDFSLCGGEGMIRWELEEGVLMPGQFLPDIDAERMHAISRHVIRQAIRDLAANGRLPALSINLEPYMLQDRSLLTLIADELALWNVAPERLTLEITENGMVGSLDNLPDEYHLLRGRGVRVALDDFGTGYSSLSQFKSLPVDELKVDRSFIAQLRTDVSNRYLTRLMVDLGHFFDMSVVAEGVETEDVARALREIDCDVLQGFFFSPALPVDEFLAWTPPRLTH